MQRHCFIFARSVATLVLAVLCLSPAASAQRVKVNKEQITFFPPDAVNRAAVVAEAGAITNAGEDVGVYAENMRTSQRVDIPLNDDGSFRTVLNDAEVGDQIRIYANRPRVNRSYGTFVVPGEPPAAAEPAARPGTRAAGPLSPSQDRGAGAGQLAVLAVVIDTATGQIIDSATITGVTLSPVQNADQLRGIASRLLDRCLAMVRQELRMPSAILHQMGPIERPVLPEETVDEPVESEQKERATSSPAPGDPNLAAMPFPLPEGEGESGEAAP